MAKIQMARRRNKTFTKNYEDRYNADGTWTCLTCDTTISGASHNVSSHIANHHQQGAYQANQDASSPARCDDPECKKNKHKYKNWHSFYRHHRAKHDFSGKSAGLKEHYKALGRKEKGLSEKSENQRDKEKEKEEEDVASEDELFVPGPDQVRKDFDRDGNQPGPSSGAAQQISVP
ncbi:hypothetical protein SCUP234_02514 [Seiridium cupressi]